MCVLFNFFSLLQVENFKVGVHYTWADRLVKCDDVYCFFCCCCCFLLDHGSWAHAK